MAVLIKQEEHLFLSGHVGDDPQTLLTFSWGGWLTKVNFNNLKILIFKVVMGKKNSILNYASIQLGIPFPNKQRHTQNIKKIPSR